MVRLSKLFDTTKRYLGGGLDLSVPCPFIHTCLTWQRALQTTLLVFLPQNEQESLASISYLCTIDQSITHQIILHYEMNYYSNNDCHQNDKSEGGGVHDTPPFGLVISALALIGLAVVSH